MCLARTVVATAGISIAASVRFWLKADVREGLTSGPIVYVYWTFRTITSALWRVVEQCEKDVDSRKTGIGNQSPCYLSSNPSRAQQGGGFFRVGHGDAFLHHQLQEGNVGGVGQGINIEAGHDLGE